MSAKTKRRQIRIDGERFYSNRLAWFYVHGRWPDGVVDHRDLDTTNDAIGNLRDATVSQNVANQAPRSKTGAKGVYRHRDKYVVHIVKDRKMHYVGVYDTIEEASAAYMEAADRLHGEFARY